MLLLARKKQEGVVIGTPGTLGCHLKVTVLEINGKQVKLGFEADGEGGVSIQRWELWQRIHGVELSEAFAEEHSMPVGQKSVVTETH
jgi:carbon storage regulator CsrA